MSARRSSASDSVESLLGGDAKRRKLSDNEERKDSLFVLDSDDQADSEHMPMSFPSRIKSKVTRAPKGDLDIKLSEETELDNGKMVDKTISFGAMNVAPWLLASLSAMEIRCPTAIQKACIPDIIAGRSVIGGSKTGSGKTLTFAIPMLQKLAEDPRGIFGLVITPTRELALQIYEQFMAISYRFELKAALITGGQDWIKQTRALKEKPHIVIATPGRLADHIVSSGPDIVIALKRVQILVLDEADRLLAEDAGMMPHLETCLDALPSSEERQTCLFTATMTSEVLQLKDMPCRGSTAPISVYEVGLDDPAAVPASLSLTYLTVPAQYRDAYLHVLLQTPQNSKHGAIIVFANKTSTVNLLERLLKGLGHSVTSLHSGLQQSERIANLARFRASASRIIVATDVASRGLDIPQVGLVINYDVPASPDDYIHRVGRTARAGRTGEALTLVGPRDELRINAIESRVGRLMVEFRQDGVNVETRVLRDSVKIVGEIKRKVLIGIEEGRDAKGNRNIRHLKRVE